MYRIPGRQRRLVSTISYPIAIKEEGIFRLSGSTLEIQKLKERFNQEGDVDLLASGEFYDVHAISGLLKLWFRELASPVLTSEMQQHFLSITENHQDRESRVTVLKRLLAHLPRANYTLMRVLIGHLIHIVQNQSVNKMTSRNVGIVFAPTLNIPSGVFTLMMSEHNTVFIWDGLPDSELEREEFRISGGSLEPEVEEDQVGSPQQPRRRPKQMDKSRRIELSHSIIGGEFDGIDFRTDPELNLGIGEEGDESRRE
jgi:RalA-binding protein 1